jgi:hypothetical protein
MAVLVVLTIAAIILVIVTKGKLGLANQPEN